MFKRISIVLLASAMLTVSAAASTVSFYVVEAGKNEKADSKISDLWETAFMDVFFEAGYIISNAPVMQLARCPSNILQIVDFKEAAYCGIDYMLIVLLDYKQGEARPEEISFYVFKVNKREKITESKIRQRTYSRNAREEYDNMKSIARGFVPYIGD
ncbi:MAG: hypothetical protein LBC76_01405 [Treponema sp.]|jgi:hypothetical protein|nr:hypothetical protein [Treponema sp.]